MDTFPKGYRIKIRERRELEKYFSVARKLFDNFKDDTLCNDRLYESYKRGCNLWNSLCARWETLMDMESPEAFYFAMEGADTRMVFLQFIECAEKRGFSLKHCAEPLMLCIGEGSVAKDSVDILAARVAPDSEVHLICGPVMIRSDRKRGNALDAFNDLISDYLMRKHYKLSVYANKFICLDDCFVGYFHAYILGDVILFETPHKLSTDTPKSWRLLCDATLANAAREFFGDYARDYARKLDEENIPQMIDALPTYGEAYYNHIFGSCYIDNLVTLGTEI